MWTPREDHIGGGRPTQQAAWSRPCPIPGRRWYRLAVTSTVVDPKLEQLTAPAYLAGITEVPLERVRAMRAECQAVENALSYVRRLAQGRLDIVGAELERRREGGDPANLRELIGRLPDILADRSSGGGGSSSGGGGPVFGRPPSDLSTEDVIVKYTGDLDEILSPAAVGSVADLSDAELEAVRDNIAAFERTTSQRRHAMHTVIDTLQAEITRRYRTGEATVDTLLQ